MERRAYGNSDIARELISLGLQDELEQSRQGDLVFGYRIEEVVLGLRCLGICAGAGEDEESLPPHVLFNRVLGASLGAQTLLDLERRLQDQEY
jgi:hypothetical protein